MRIRSNSQKSINQDFNKELDLPFLAEGLNRRAFLRAGSSISLLASLMACKPPVPKLEKDSTAKQQAQSAVTFSKVQLKTLDAIQMQLFPNDGNGPSARDLNALGYLQLAMQDSKNQQDGDPEFIVKGVGWLDDLSQSTLGDIFINLESKQQDQILKRIAKSSTGRNWLSLLLYYLTEVLTLDPIYGGNPNQIGWQWLEHQPGFPRPTANTTYKDFK